MNLPEQQKFVDEIKALNDKIETLEKEIDDIKEEQKVLLQKYV